MSNLNRAERQPVAASLHTSLRKRPLLGTGRLGVISGYFQLSGIGAALQTVYLTAAIVFPRIRSVGAPRPFALLATSALLTFGFLRTSHLLDERRRSGALAAALCFIPAIAGYFTGHGQGLIDVGFAAVGLGLVASIWKYLEND